VRNYAASTLLNVDDVRNANRIYQRREVRKQSNRHDDPRHAVLLTALVTARLRLWLCGRCPSERIKRGEEKKRQRHRRRSSTRKLTRCTLLWDKVNFYCTSQYSITLFKHPCLGAAGLHSPRWGGILARQRWAGLL